MSDIGKKENEIYCSHCGAVILKEAEICPKCGCKNIIVQNANPSESGIGLKTIINFFIPIAFIVIGIILIIMAC